MASTAASVPSSPIRNRWFQLIIGIIGMIAIANLQYGWTLFVNPIKDEHQWATAAIQVAFTTFIFVETWLVPIEGWLIDKFGPSVITIVGGVLVGISWTMYGYADTLWMFYIGAVIGGIGAGIVYGTTVGQALKWFPDKRGLTAGLTAAGFGAGSAVTIVPIAQMINVHGYHYTFIFWGILQGIVVMLVGIFLRAPKPGEVPFVSPTVSQTKRDFLPGQMLKTPIFYVMYLAMLCVAIGGVMATAQLGPIARDFIVDEVPVTLFLITLPALQWALVCDRILNGLARPAFGWLSDQIGRENTMFIAFGGQAIIILIFIKVAANPLLFVIFSALVFFTYGEIFSLFPSLSADTFGRKFATANYGFLYTAKGTAALLVPYANIIKDATGTWVYVFYFAAGLNVCAALIAMFIIKPMRKRKTNAEALLTDPAILSSIPT
jgi:OFA family oxalate/formate antiporter-like MFS transporter